MRESKLPKRIQEFLDEAVRRIVEVSNPQAIILFGSYAEGRASEGSDLDLLVIARTRHVGLLTERIYEAVAEASYGRWHKVPAVDILVLTPSQWRQESQLPGQLPHRVKRTGVTIYGQAA